MFVQFLKLAQGLYYEQEFSKNKITRINERVDNKQKPCHTLIL